MVPGREVARAASGYLPSATAGLLVEQLNTVSGTDYPADLLTFPTHSRAGAPAEGKRHPVVLLSSGFGFLAAFHTGLAEELASRGYVVAGIDHTFDAEVVEFRGGRLELRSIEEIADFERSLATRVADTRFVLDRLTELATGPTSRSSRRLST